jgi:membrane-associated phospholipid phosphatase
MQLLSKRITCQDQKKFIKKQVIFIVIFLLSSHVAFSQVEESLSSSDETTWHLLKYDMKNIFNGVGYSYSRPLKWEGKQWGTFGAIAGGTGLLHIVDEETSRFARNQQEGVPDFIRSYGTTIGSPQYNYMLTGGVYLTGLFTKNEKLRRTGVLLLASNTSAGLLQHIAKSLIGRARPVGERGKDTFQPFSTDRNFHSFPSGHTILAFTNAYAIAKQFENPWVKSGIYVVGLIPGISRLWDGQHWLSDVALSVALSIFTVESIDRYLDSKYEQKYNTQEKKVSWQLNLGVGQVGVTGRF